MTTTYERLAAHRRAGTLHAWRHVAGAPDRVTVTATLVTAAGAVIVTIEDATLAACLTALVWRCDAVTGRAAA